MTTYAFLKVLTFLITPKASNVPTAGMLAPPGTSNGTGALSTDKVAAVIVGLFPGLVVVTKVGSTYAVSRGPVLLDDIVHLYPPASNAKYVL